MKDKMCDQITHDLLNEEYDVVNCIFCSKQIQDPGKPKRYFCCDSMKMAKDRHLVCKNCGQVHDEYFATEYVDFYENRHKIRKKSVYHRKYHIMNVMNDIAQKNNIQIGYHNREKILRIFKLIDQNSPEVDIGWKRVISVNFILKQLFDILEIKYNFIPLTKSKKTLNYYSQWWAQIYDLIKEDIN